MREILSLMVFGLTIMLSAGCSDKSKPTVTMPATTSQPKAVGDGAVKPGGGGGDSKMSEKMEIAPGK